MLVECVPNFSEGRDPDVIGALVEAAGSLPGAAVLDVHSDLDHNRTVITLAGEGEAVLEGAYRAVAVAVERIDLTKHEGVHPRVGAADVVPFVPLVGATPIDCVRLAERLAERLAADLDLPCCLYAGAARSDQRRRLPWIRQPGFEGLAKALATDERAPDYGPREPHPTAGMTVVGARPFLLAFNVDLATDSVKVAKAIARKVRESSGGLAGVQAKGLDLQQQGRVQVSMNLLDIETHGLGIVFRAIERLARDAGVEIARSELVGLIPRSAVIEAAESLLTVEPTLVGRVLEDRLAATLFDPGGSLTRTLAQVASPGPLDPGGGSAVALSLALGRACLQKALLLSRGGKGQLDDAALSELADRLPTEAKLIAYAADDHRAFANLMAAWRLPKGADRKGALRLARGPAVSAPFQLMEAAVALAEAAAVLAEQGNPNLVNDAVAAAELALATGRVARLNARANQKKADRQDYADLMQRLEAAAARARARSER